MRIRSVAVGSFFLSIAFALPTAASAEALSGVMPTSMSVQAHEGSDAASKSMRITPRANGVTFTTAAAAQTSSTDWVFCATEGGYCTFTGTMEVRYGANGSYYYKTLTGGTACTNAVFGDPLSGATKQCHIRAASTTTTSTSTSWTFCANEGGYCTFTGTMEVRYGANGSYYYKTLTGGTACTNAVFGDPLYGASKQCYVRSASTSTTTSTSTSWTFCAYENGVCSFSGTQQVRYGANGSYYYKTLTGGTACTNAVFGDPIYGVGKQCHVGSSTSTTTTTTSPPPPSTGYGPQSTITCPSSAVNIWPGTNIQTMVDMYPGNTTFCIRAGTYNLRSSITPKTGDTFVGEYGAILDGTGWSTSDGTQAAFRAHNQDIDYVTIRNLRIRNMPQRGIHAYYWMSDHWTIEYNEIASSGNTGVVIPHYTVVRNNNIHHNAFAGYMGQYVQNSTFEGNEIAYNGDGQKLGETTNVTFRNNFVHHNVGGGIWYDSNNTGAIVEGNRVEDNGWLGIFYEASNGGIIRNNASRRNLAGVMLSVSKNVQIYNNTLEQNSRGIIFHLNCPSLGGTTSMDLANNSAYDNVITVGTQSGALASALSYGNCTTTQVAPYLSGSKNLTFSRNTYRVPSVSGRYWVWGTVVKSWAEWLAIPQDTSGTVSQ